MEHTNKDAEALNKALSEIGTIELDESLFFLGNKVEHKISVGNIRFMTLEEYLSVQGELSLIVMNSLHMYYTFTKNMKTKAERKNLWFLRDADLFDVVRMVDEEGRFLFYSFYKAYVNVYSLIFTREQIVQIMTNRDVFHETRRAFMKMQVLTEERVTKYAMTQKAFERRKKMMIEQMKGKSPTIADIASAVSVGTGLPYKEIADYTVYQLYLSYHRIASFNDYQTSILYSTVAPKVDIVSWAEHIDMYKTDTTGDLDADDFMAKHGK